MNFKCGYLFLEDIQLKMSGLTTELQVQILFICRS